jgi:hypothetical protein
LAEQKERDNEKFGNALGIKSTYTPGSSFSADRQVLPFFIIGSKILIIGFDWSLMF